MGILVRRISSLSKDEFLDFFAALLSPVGSINYILEANAQSTLTKQCTAVDSKKIRTLRDSDNNNFY